MEEPETNSEIPLTPVRSSGLDSNFSEHSSSVVPNDGTANSVSSASAYSSSHAPLSPQRSIAKSVSSSPASASVHTRESAHTREPINTQADESLQIPSLQTPAQTDQAGFADLFNEFDYQATTESSEARNPFDYQDPTLEPQTESDLPNPFVSEEDEQTDPSSSVTPNENNPAYTRNDATSTFGRVIQPLKVSIQALENYNQVLSDSNICV